ncbi:MAG: nucleoside deaminase [Desulfosalsimonas sp.]|uniref:nucleoside deaminase n=1 Tax=Desulfosalsimonas sp. TaxID=3073848 RepID=UPI00397091BE
MNHQKADETYMRAALDQAQQALDAGEFPVGCVIAGPGGVIAGGGRSHSRQQRPSEIDHAEINALKQFYELSYTGDPRQLSIYTTLEPCLMCFAAILIADIGRIVYAYEDVMGGGTACKTDNLPPLYRNAGVRVVSNMMRRQSLDLFFRFFSDPENTYLCHSMLAAYTLAQKPGGRSSLFSRE